MLETLTTARPLYAPDPRPNAPGSESAATAARAAPTEEQPLPAPSELLRLTLQSPPPPAQPVRSGVADEGSAPPASVAEPVFLAEAEVPPGLNAISLFQGMLTEASRSGANVPGTSMHIYALVQQLSTLVENKLETAA
ncbi:hypothetical protein KUV28_12895 [Ferrimonas balearica]|nr:hypothetical protein [Ferrimonas balearica]